MPGELNEGLALSPIFIGTAEAPKYNPEFFYQQHKPGLMETVAAAIQVNYYKTMLRGDVSYQTYNTFRDAVPITLSNDLFPPTDFYTGDPKELVLYHSGGSTGNRIKEIAYPHEGITAHIDESVIKQLKEAKNPTILHKDVHALSYIVVEKSLKEQAPNVGLTTYLPASEVLGKIRENDVIYVTDQVSKFRELMHELEKQALQSPDEFSKIFKGKKFFIELGSEPIDIDEVNRWYEFIARNTGVEPELWGLYGCTENLLIGMWVYKPGDTRVRYEIKGNRFVEVLKINEDMPVVQGEDGRVVVTPLHAKDYEGTVLLRYDTGDYATIETEGEKMFLSNIRRKPEDGMISVWGHKIFAPQIHDVLEKELGFPVAMDISYDTIQVETGEQIVLDIILSSQEFGDDSKIEQAGEELDTALTMTIPAIQEFIDGHKLSVNVSFAQEAAPNFKKAWRIRRGQRRAT